MSSVDGINQAISDLISKPTSMDTAQKLASLYILRDKLSQIQQESGPETTDTTEAELNDILPCYREYREVKRKYQLQEISENAVLDSLDDVCEEIEEFMNTLFNGTDMPEERKRLSKLITNLQKIKTP